MSTELYTIECMWSEIFSSTLQEFSTVRYVVKFAIHPQNKTKSHQSTMREECMLVARCTLRSMTFEPNVECRRLDEIGGAEMKMPMTCCVCEMTRYDVSHWQNLTTPKNVRNSLQMNC